MTLDVYADLFDSDLMDVARMLDAAVQVETDMDAIESLRERSVSVR